MLLRNALKYTLKIGWLKGKSAQEQAGIHCKAHTRHYLPADYQYNMWISSFFCFNGLSLTSLKCILMQYWFVLTSFFKTCNIHLSKPTQVLVFRQNLSFSSAGSEGKGGIFGSTLSASQSFQRLTELRSPTSIQDGPWRFFIDFCIKSQARASTSFQKKIGFDLKSCGYEKFTATLVKLFH